ncbi:hypothetical protein EUGRSUZ_A01462 [Eucalyptus grandis]|uniref:Uncharacterized protein n=2 Tax=Eucalyptus grandis TaxID=71139 RepID=A0ACC3M320_EUCGR|nr:hypothetical protein EUGRSUZ_A01462 [Eucalyptus grandis]
MYVCMNENWSSYVTGAVREVEISREKGHGKRENVLDVKYIDRLVSLCACFLIQGNLCWRARRWRCVGGL